MKLLIQFSVSIFWQGIEVYEQGGNNFEYVVVPSDSKVNNFNDHEKFHVNSETVDSYSFWQSMTMAF